MIKYEEIEQHIDPYSGGVPYFKECIIKKIPVSITCDCCKKEFTLNDCADDFDALTIQEFIKTRLDMGYGSYSDGDRLSVDFCHECYIKICHEKIGKEYFDKNCILEG